MYNKTMIALDDKITKQLLPKTKIYGVFAVNKNDPNAILGYVENSFSMGWSKDFVNIWEGCSKKQVEKL